MAVKTKQVYQQSFFEKLKTTIPQHISLVNEISEILEISTDGAYRRIRGETAMSMDELIILCSHFRIPLETISAPGKNVVSFNYKVLGNEEENFKSYLFGVRDDLHRLNKMDAVITFSAEDTPIFHYFNWPNLSSFKIFYWQKAILNVPSLQGQKFQKPRPDHELESVAKEIFDAYQVIPSVEIWTEETIVSVVRQIEFFWESGNFETRELALQVCTELQEMVSYLKRAAEMSCKMGAIEPAKTTEGNFTMYQSDVLIGNNTIFVSAGEIQATYLAYNSFNSMITYNPAFCSDVNVWLKNLIKKSLLISGVGEKQRQKFFTKALNRIKEAENRIINS